MQLLENKPSNPKSKSKQKLHFTYIYIYKNNLKHGREEIFGNLKVGIYLTGRQG